ncbi:MAG: hypothetical protein OEY32_14005 [Candidatus Krumholzibacteria bacterium]|nr:hypothetical protein [Candidatus Krumholzibacteria bacterium]
MLLRSLSDEVILARIKHLVRRERAMTLRVLDHLAEIERRKLHLALGHSSMFDYCTRGLGYSESAAWRRIQSMRCMVRFPEVRAMLESNDLNLSTLAHVARVLTWENKDELLANIRGCSLAEVKAILARREPRAAPRDVIRPLGVRREVRSPGPAGELRLVQEVAGEASARAGVGSACENSDYCRSGSKAGPATPVLPAVPADRPVASVEGNSAAAVTPLETEMRTRLSFTAGAEFMSALDRIKALAWHRLGTNRSLEQVFTMTMDPFLEKNDPIRRRARRLEREQKANARAVAIPG